MQIVDCERNPTDMNNLKKVVAFRKNKDELECDRGIFCLMESMARNYAVNSSEEWHVGRL